MSARSNRKGIAKRSDQASENMEQATETMNEATQVSTEDMSDLQPLAQQLIDALGAVPNGDLVGDMVGTAMKLLRDKTNRGDVKLIDKSYKELRYALKVFAPYREVRKVSLFGSARTLESHDDYRQAAAYALGVVAQLHIVLEMVEEGRRHRHVAVLCEGLADIADVLVDPEDLLHHHERAARRDVRLRAPRADAAAGGFQGHPLAHRPLPCVGPG